MQELQGSECNKSESQVDPRGTENEDSESEGQDDDDVKKPTEPLESESEYSRAESGPKGSIM